MNQGEFLREQSEMAKTAMGATLRDAGKEATHLLDPRIWVKSHPWKTLTMAAAMGFAIGDSLKKPRQKEEPKPAEKPAEETSSKPAPPPAQEKRSRLGPLLWRILKRGSRILMTAAQPMIQEAIAAYGASHNGSHHHEPERSQDGNYPPQSPPHAPDGL